MTDGKDAQKVAFITCVNDREAYAECRLYLEHVQLPSDFTAEYFPIEHAPSMAAGYNQAMKQSTAKYKVYLHQDTLVVNQNLIADALQIFANPKIGMIGVIGARSLPASGIWWDGMRIYGRVLHACEPESVVDSQQKEPQGAYVDVEGADGLFLMTQYDVPWREDLFTGWHLYDVSAAREFARRGYKTVVPNQKKLFWCIHCPQEKPLAPEYKQYQKLFLQEYAGEFFPEV